MISFKEWLLNEAAVTIHTMTTAHKILTKNGFEKVSDSGPHTKFVHPVTKKSIAIPKHKGDLSIGVNRQLAAVLKP
jgi:predicted RNA binding protein YcfA (HicA-like mRNA interferase family)